MHSSKSLVPPPAAAAQLAKTAIRRILIIHVLNSVLCIRSFEQLDSRDVYFVIGSLPVERLMKGGASSLREVDIHVDAATAAAAHGVVPSTMRRRRRSGSELSLDMKVNIINDVTSDEGDGDGVRVEMMMIILIMMMIMMMRMEQEEILVWILWKILLNQEELLMFLFLMSSIIRCIFRVCGELFFFVVAVL